MTNLLNLTPEEQRRLRREDRAEFAVLYRLYRAGRVITQNQTFKTGAEFLKLGFLVAVGAIRRMPAGPGQHARHPHWVLNVFDPFASTRRDAHDDEASRQVDALVQAARDTAAKRRAK